MSDLKKSLKIEGLKLKEFYNWPLAIKMVTGGILFILVLLIGYILLLKPSQERYEDTIRKETQLKTEFLNKKKEAVNLDLYLEQLKQVQADSETLLRQLPNQSEIATLLVDINQVGLSRGLVFELFKPEKEKVLEFYAELPISIRVKGSYKAIGEFASDVAQLSRVVIFTDMTITNKDDVVYLSVVAKTFRYLNQQELDNQKRIKDEARKKDKKAKRGK
jgi:type IV pilus assembly protein PilO